MRTTRKQFSVNWLTSGRLAFTISGRQKNNYNNTTLVDCLLSRDDFDFSVADTLGNDRGKAVIRRVTIPQTWREHLPENAS